MFSPLCTLCLSGEKVLISFLKEGLTPVGNDYSAFYYEAMVESYGVNLEEHQEHKGKMLRIL